MKQKTLGLITVFVLLNFFIGRVFQESTAVVCLYELGVIATASFIFWLFFSKKIKEITKKMNVFDNTKNFLIHGGVGMSSSILNILLSQAVLIGLTAVLFGCSTPSFKFINASFTNNIAVNLLCYFSLVFYFLYIEDKNAIQKDLKVEINQNNYTGLLSLSLGNTIKVVHIDKIKFIEASNNCIVIYTDVGKFVKYQSLKSFLNENHTDTIKRVHRSYAVNINKIDSVKKNKNGDGVITLHDEQTVKLSRNYGLKLLS